MRRFRASTIVVSDRAKIIFRTGSHPGGARGIGKFFHSPLVGAKMRLGGGGPAETPALS